MKNILIIALFMFAAPTMASAQPYALSEQSTPGSVFLSSSQNNQRKVNWKMRRVSPSDNGSIISADLDNAKGWTPAIIPGTILNSLVAAGKYPEPYFGDNNRKERNLIPDISQAEPGFYNYWFKTSFALPESFSGKQIWLKFHGINYRSEIWLNGKKVGQMAGMFNSGLFNVTSVVKPSQQNVLAVKVLPIDVPGTSNKQTTERAGAIGENRNGGDGEIGKNVTMLMSVGWDFTAPDGIRDRNTGIWREVELFASGAVILENAFVKSKINLPDTTSSEQEIEVQLTNATSKKQTGILKTIIKGTGISISSPITLDANEIRVIKLKPEQYKQLKMHHPKLWWPLNKGAQYLYGLQMDFIIAGRSTHRLETKFGIREIRTDINTPDSSRRFLVNGVPVFIRGSNWIPEAMLRNSTQRTNAELRYTKQAGINFLRLWGGGIAESDYFYQRCDELGIMVWSEFWITGDTRFPLDTSLYFKNLTSTIKRIRNHASSAYYVSANESTEIPGAKDLINSLDPTKDYQAQSECCGIHDGSPYKYENPMQYFENTASKRGSRVDGFNPEYGTPILPIISSLKLLMPAQDLWPINKVVWDYQDGGGFHQMTTKYHQAVEAFGKSSSIEEYARKAQFVGAMNFRALWEVWNYNKFGWGDRYASGLLFWYHNSPLPQTSSRFYDWFLEPTAALYYTQNALAPLHPQFDYLKNTISISNDYRRSFQGFTLKAIVYDLDSKARFNQEKTVDIPADGLVKDAVKIIFPEDISSIHFIKLLLYDAQGKLVADAFYWRSKDKYQGAWTMTGPAVSGFEDIKNLKPTSLILKYSNTAGAKKKTLHINLTNAGSSIAFFTQLRIENDKNESIRPVFYSDNFINLIPGETKNIEIEIPTSSSANQVLKLYVDAYNAKEQVFILKK